jgi:fructose-1,6-bisphosphatase I
VTVPSQKQGIANLGMDDSITLKKVLETQDPSLGKLVSLLSELAFEVSMEIPRGKNITDHVNTFGENQLQIDIWSSELFQRRLMETNLVRYFASEELAVPSENKTGEFTVVMDPIDGSSNAESDNLLGTIVGIYYSTVPPAKGRHLLASLYFLYGPYLELVLALKDGVREFFPIGEGSGVSEKLVWDGRFARFPDHPAVYGVGGLRVKWIRSVATFVSELETQEFKLRYGGSLVGDFNQVLRKGGFFSYPGLIDEPAGKYRLQYEANPISFIVENAGGKASSGREQILDIEPESLTQRVPFYVGNSELVKRFESIFKARAI